MEVIRIGIDQSLTSTAVTIIFDNNDQSLVYTDVIETKRKDFDDIFYRVEYIANRIIFFLEKHIHVLEDIYTEVMIEGLSFGSSTNATRDLAALQHAIISTIRSSQYGDIIRVIAPTSLKKFAGGKGNAKKEEMYEFLPPYIKDFFNKTPKSRGRYDLMDSYFLAFYQNGKIFKDPFIHGNIDFEDTFFDGDKDMLCRQITAKRVRRVHREFNEGSIISELYDEICCHIDSIYVGFGGYSVYEMLDNYEDFRLAQKEEGYL
jgi:Holliday junction resolvasome RuvABC endonuclease subunit